MVSDPNMFYSLTQSLRDLSQTVRDLQREMQLQVRVCTEPQKGSVQQFNSVQFNALSVTNLDWPLLCHYLRFNAILTSENTQLVVYDQSVVHIKSWKQRNNSLPRLTVLSAKVTVTPCFVYKVIRDFWSIYHFCINPIHSACVFLTCDTLSTG